MINFGETLDLVMNLPTNEKEMLIDIVNKRLIDEQRSELADYAAKVRNAYLRSEIKSKPFDDIIKELNETEDGD